MSHQTLSDNPYAVNSIEPATPSRSSSEPLLLVNNRTNIGGRLWSPCMQTIYHDRIELKFLMQNFTIPVERIRLLRSGGKRHGRHLEIVHDDRVAPETIQFIPLFPGKWYEAFEALGIPTEDSVQLRESKQYYHRSSEWITNAEAIFWGTWIALIILIPIAVGVCKFLTALF